MDNSISDILTVEEAALLLKIPRSSVYKLAQEGKLPGQKVGKHWRFNRNTLLNWISGRVKFEEKSNNKGSLDFS